MPVYITQAGARRRWKARPVHRAPVQGQTFLDGECDTRKFPYCVFFICLVTQKTLPKARTRAIESVTGFTLSVANWLQVLPPGVAKAQNLDARWRNLY